MSSRSDPAITVRRLARSQADLPKIPEASKVVEDGRIPFRDTKAIGALRAYTAVKEVGQLTDPCVSLPNAKGAKPIAIATAEPPDEPHGWFGFN